MTSSSFRWLVMNMACLFLGGQAVRAEMIAESAETEVRNYLVKMKLAEGCNVSGNIFIAVGVAECEIQDCKSQKFLSLRNELALKAEWVARSKIADFLNSCAYARESLVVEGNGNVAVRAMQVDIDKKSNCRLQGCHLLFNSESYAKGVYQIAVIVKWERASDSRAVSSARNGEGWTVDWGELLADFEFERVIGSRKIDLGDGSQCYVGFGFSDIEGHGASSLHMRRARMEAMAQARMNLLAMIKSEIISECELLRLRKNANSKKCSCQFETDFESFVSQNHSGMTQLGSEVFSARVVHPITKRKMYVSVCGYEPAELAKLMELQDRRCQSFGDAALRQNGLTRNKKSEAEPRLIKVFNYATGKYEEVYK